MTASRPGLPPLHLLLALAVMVVWGSNFVVIKAALADLPPLTLALALIPLLLVALLAIYLPARSAASVGSCCSCRTGRTSG